MRSPFLFRAIAQSLSLFKIKIVGKLSKAARYQSFIPERSRHKAIMQLYDETLFLWHDLLLLFIITIV
ncbi:MAG: hypothetical protein MUD14_04465 [Hydrococcus sp. Prado102]|jgi:hypothetical protein|nr:hypothetical protein [Hydrococcus sp. Prado102]